MVSGGERLPILRLTVRIPEEKRDLPRIVASVEKEMRRKPDICFKVLKAEAEEIGRMQEGYNCTYCRGVVNPGPVAIR